MRPNLLLCLTFSLYACGGGGSNTSDPQQEDHSGPEIVSDTINPSSAGTAPVAIKDFAHVQITVVFNEPIDRSTLVSAIGLTSNAAATPLLNAEDIVYTATPPTVVVSPKNLSEGASYTFKITTALKDVAGNRLVKEKTKSFTTANSAKIFAHVTGLADGTQFMLNPNLSGGLGGAVAVGNGDTLVATKLDVGDTYKISLTNVPAGRFCSPELSDGAVTGTTTINISCGDVLPRYAVAPQWNDYAQTANPDTACAADTASPQTQLGYTSCLHGGEQRTMKVPNAQACTDIDIKATTDNFPQPNGVGAFEWRCETLNNEVYVTSTHLKDQARLVDLIDLADPNRPKWREARVTVTYANKVQYQSLPSRWWANPIKNASTLSPSALDGTIWVADHAQASSITSVSLKGKKAAFVVERGVALNNLTKGTQHDAMQIGVNGSDNAHFHWLEGNFIVTRSPGQNTDANTVHYAGIRMYGQYNVIRHTTIYDQGNSNGLNADNVRNNLIEHVSIFGSGFAGISLIGDYNTLSDVALGGHGFQGINANVKDTAGMYVLGAHNTFTHITSLGNAGYGILLECNSTRPNTYNRIAFGTVSNNLGAGLVVKCNHNAVSGLTIANNGGDGIVLEGEAHHLHHITTALNTGSAVTNLSAVSDVGDILSILDADKDTTVNEVTRANTSQIVGLMKRRDFSDLFNHQLDTPYWRQDATRPSQAWGFLYNTSTPLHTPPSLVDAGACHTSQYCGLWDWSLASNANNGTNPQVLNVWSATPNAVGGVDHAIELIGDGLGDDNGICDKNETCLFAPNRGAYQGHGALVQGPAITNCVAPACTTTLKKFEFNGD